jgi:hypothetical protein
MNLPVHKTNRSLHAIHLSFIHFLSIHLIRLSINLIHISIRCTHLLIYIYLSMFLCLTVSLHDLYFYIYKYICVCLCVYLSKTKKLNSVAFSPQTNYTDRATAACRRSYCQLLRIEGVAWSAQRIPMAV